jgi:hypothetical protein
MSASWSEAAVKAVVITPKDTGMVGLLSEAPNQAAFLATV